jgi:hypothetical protein
MKQQDANGLSLASLSLTITFVVHCLSVALCYSRMFSVFVLSAYISASYE